MMKYYFYCNIVFFCTKSNISKIKHYLVGAVFSNFYEKSIKERGFVVEDKNNEEKKEQVVFTTCSWSADKAGCVDYDTRGNLCCFSR